MALGQRGISLQLKIFSGLILVSLLCVAGTTLISYLVIRRVAQVQNETSLQNKSLALTTALDYAIVHSHVTKENIAAELRYKLMEISDINGLLDIILYDSKGNFLVSNRDASLIKQKKYLPKFLARFCVVKVGP